MSQAEYEREAKERWGDSDAYSESAHRTKNYTAEDFALAKKRAAEVVVEFIDAMSAGLPPDSPQAAAAAEAHRQNITDWYYECTYEIQAGLAQMYVSDSRFREHYDSQHEGLAQYVHDAILANAINKS